MTLNLTLNLIDEDATQLTNTEFTQHAQLPELLEETAEDLIRQMDMEDELRSPVQKPKRKLPFESDGTVAKKKPTVEKAQNKNTVHKKIRTPTIPSTKAVVTVTPPAITLTTMQSNKFNISEDEVKRSIEKKTNEALIPLEKALSDYYGTLIVDDIGRKMKEFVLGIVVDDKTAKDNMEAQKLILLEKIQAIILSDKYMQ